MDFITQYDIGVNKPDIPEEIHENWQKILNLLATIANVPAALVMHVLPDRIKVEVTSKTQPQENPYEVDASESLGCGLYCETVMKDKSVLHVKNSLKDDAWKDNPDVELDMIGYYGLPLLWPDKTVFGTICILDKKDLVPSVSVMELIELFRSAIENDLKILDSSHAQKALLQAEIEKQTYQIEKQNRKLLDLNENLEQRVKEEVEKNRDKDFLLMQKSRHAQMGEMISMIAHQWRQPLASISSISGTLTMDVIMDEYKKEFFKERLDAISELSTHLSSTINDFRNFFKETKKRAPVQWQHLVKSSLKIIEPTLLTKNITVHPELNDNKTINTYPNEMRQVILNIIKNAEDILLENEIENGQIWITSFAQGNNTILQIEDNAGGVPDTIIHNIFDPYFSTKEKKDGTGVGLYMSKIIIEEHCLGSLAVRNTQNGALFEITVPYESS